MKFKAIITSLLVTQLSLAVTSFSYIAYAGDHAHEEKVEEAEKGPNNGRMLREGDFAIELAIFEKGVPPEFRVFASKAGKAIPAQKLEVNITLTRLGNVVDDINFIAEGEYLRGDMEVYEPHSFVVDLSVTYQGKSYQWSYENFEGRTHISEDLAKLMAIQTELVSSQILADSVKVFGKLTLPANAVRHISARFPGEIKTMNVAFGEKVKKGQTLLTIESNESLQSYQVIAPINGVITYQEAGVGEQSGEQTLLTITNTKTLLAELNVFPMQQSKVKLGAEVNFSITGSKRTFTSKLNDMLFNVNAQQAKVYRAEIDNSLGEFNVGQFVSADIIVDRYEVPLAVKSSALQSFRDFTVVFAKVGQEYEVRMLELGRKSGPWVEVLSGINAGTKYVSENSYIIKADIDKSGASHDH